jgi:hypothetical protein
MRPATHRNDPVKSMPILALALAALACSAPGASPSAAEPSTAEPSSTEPAGSTPNAAEPAGSRSILGGPAAGGAGPTSSPEVPVSIQGTAGLRSAASDPRRGTVAPRPEGGGLRTPDEHLGRPLGADFTLADWGEVSSYYRHLAEASPRVRTEVVGTTTEGRDFLLSIVSSEENLARLEELRGHAAVIADPRGRSEEELAAALERGRPFLFVSLAMHATECAGAQFGMAFTHALATSEAEPWKSAREECVVFVIPSMNPDGLDRVTSWYRETVGTPYEAADLLELYQHYAGHDNNRDWFMLTQAETRITSELLYRDWHPQVYWDVHQQGSTRERFFVPPFRDPLNPNLDPSIIAGIDTLGSRALLDLTREGRTGVSTGVSYDMWWNGGNRNVPVRHNIIGLLTEAASANLASPIFLPIDELSAPRGLGGYAPSNRFPDPWPGGWWRLRDIIDYELAFGRSLLGSLSREPSFWLENALDASRRALEETGLEAPRAWILPADNRDPDAVRRLADVLLRTGVELHVAEGPVTVDGRTWPSGSIVLLREQPYGAHVKDLFEVQRYPDGDSPYDVAGWTLPLLLGVERIEAMAMPEGRLRRAETVEEALAAFAGDPRLEEESAALLSVHSSRSWTRLHAAGQDQRLVLSAEPETAGLVHRAAAGAPEGARVHGGRRLGLYSPWSGSMDEGWMRYVLDAWEIPYVRVRNEMLRAGRLEELVDVLVIPSVSPGQLDRGRRPGSIPPQYARGLDAEGAVAIEEFVRGGGTLITLGASSEYAIELFQLPLVDVCRGDEAGDFSCPGSVLRTVPRSHPLTAGLPPSLPVFFSRSSAWREMTAEERDERELPAPEGRLDVLLEYAPTRVLMSGWIREPEVIAGRAAWVRARHGEGTVHLFGFRPQYRGWAQATFELVHRAALLTEE